ncbi:hypothetical protein BJ944DRAFT_261200 [Cunninghamella echinulata]|nr:hypothetical protein BJ944DRAFT_261200 [Cunninghamella echinulata]
MNNIPNELLQHIFSFLSQRYISVCQQVCKKWLISTRHPKFYQSITLYSEKQLEKFLASASTLTLALDKIPFGYFVSELYLQDIFYSFDINLNITQLQQLYRCCPNLIKLDGISFIFEEVEEEEGEKEEKEAVIKENIMYWPPLKTVPFWYSTLDPSLSTHPHHDHITCLEYRVEYHFIDYHQIIQLQMDQQKRYRPAKIPSFYSLFNDPHPPPTNHEGYIEHYGNTIFFLLPSSWTQLTSLSLEFNSFNNGSNTAIYELDERLFDNIHATCPQLVSLTLKDFFMNLSDAYLYGHHPTANSLQQLHLIQCCFHDVFCFNYLSTLYSSHLSDLTLDLLWNYHEAAVTEQTKEQYKRAFFNMITEYPFLKRLATSLKYITNLTTVPLSNNIWPCMELYQWLQQHPSQLEELDYPYDLLAIDRHLQDPGLFSNLYHQNHPLDYLHHHLTTLTLRLNHPSSDVLHYLLMSDSQHASLSITSLTILQDISKPHHFGTNNNYGRYGGEDENEEDDFFIDQWLDAFPYLRKLKLQHIGNIKLKENENDHDMTTMMNKLFLGEPSHQEQQQKRKKYGLKELDIFGAYIYMNSYELSLFFASLPFLRNLSLNEVNFVYPTKKPTLPFLMLPPSFAYVTSDHEEEDEEEEEEEDNRVNYMILDISHVHLDKLELLYLRQGKSKYISYEKRTVKLIVKEKNSSHAFQIVKKTTLYPTVNIIVICKSVDTFFLRTL